VGTPQRPGEGMVVSEEPAGLGDRMAPTGWMVAVHRGPVYTRNGLLGGRRGVPTLETFTTASPDRDPTRPFGLASVAA
jgi:hypothetical protein